MASHYETLGVEPDADAKAVKRAYFRGVRKHPPEKDPEGFRRIREAYEVLSDQAARASYDALQTHGDKIAEDIEKGMAHFAEESWMEAARCFKRALLLDGNAHAARNMLGLCFLHNGNHESAIKTFAALTKRAPDVPLYFINLGHSLDEAAKEADGFDLAKSVDFTERARKAFRKAIQLEPHNSDPYLAIAETYLRDQVYEQAISFADKAIGADGQVDFQDFEALFFKCRVRLHQGELAQVTKLAGQIHALVPDDDDIKKYVAMRFAFFAHLLVKVEAFEPAGVFLRAAKQFDPSNEDLAGFGVAIDQVVGLSSDVAAIADDETILPPIKAMVSVFLAAQMGSEEVDVDGLWRQGLELLPHLPQDELHTSAKALKRKCPTFYAEHKDLVDKILSSTREAAQAARDCRKAHEDESLSPAVRMMCAFFLDVARGYYQGKDWEADADLNKLFQVFDAAPAGPAQQSMATVRRKYPSVRRVAPDLFDNIDSALKQAVQGQARYNPQPSYSASSEPSCIAAGALVLMADGSERAIEDVAAGDLIQAYDRRAGLLVTSRVRRVRQHAPQDVVGLQLGDRILRATCAHRVLAARELPHIDSLKPGEPVLSVGSGASPVAAPVSLVGDVGRLPVYNLEVEEFCTYIVDGFIVHSYVTLPEVREWLERLRVSLGRGLWLPLLLPSWSSRRGA